MIKAYVVKNGGKFLSNNGDWTKELKRAELFPTRSVARSARREGEKIYSVSLKAVEFAKVS